MRILNGGAWLSLVERYVRDVEVVPRREARSGSPRPPNVYFVYILQSTTSTGRFYVGSTDHLVRRFGEHQRGKHRATRGRGPWWMPYYEIYSTRSDAVRRERELKAKKSAKSLRRIVLRAYPELELL